MKKAIIIPAAAALLCPISVVALAQSSGGSGGTDTDRGERAARSAASYGGAGNHAGRAVPAGERLLELSGYAADVQWPAELAELRVH